ncbi:MAG: TRAP transporter small permease subunit [Calothrix sp. SM1_5_4]|nr:TRAP transporter small permease subunit [Calothrix sp. SM1_5_4]
MVFLTTLSLAGIVSINLLNVAARFIFNRPLFWNLEVSSILAVWFTFIVFGINYKENQHFKIEIVVGAFKGKMKTVYEAFADIVLMIILGFVLYSGFTSFFRNYRMTLPATGVSASLALYLPLILGAVTFVVFIAMKYLRKLIKRL